MYSYKNGFIRSNKVVRIRYFYITFLKKKGREEKKWKEKLFNFLYFLGKTP